MQVGEDRLYQRIAADLKSRADIYFLTNNRYSFRKSLSFLLDAS